jgi:hypothetical protein
MANLCIAHYDLHTLNCFKLISNFDELYHSVFQSIEPLCHA